MTPGAGQISSTIWPADSCENVGDRALGSARVLACGLWRPAKGIFVDNRGQRNKSSRRRPRRRHPGNQSAFVLSKAPLAGAPRATGETPALPGIPGPGADCQQSQNSSQNLLKLVPFQADTVFLIRVYTPVYTGFPVIAIRRKKFVPRPARMHRSLATRGAKGRTRGRVRSPEPNDWGSAEGLRAPTDRNARCAYDRRDP